MNTLGTGPSTGLTTSLGGFAERTPPAQPVGFGALLAALVGLVIRPASAGDAPDATNTADAMEATAQADSTDSADATHGNPAGNGPAGTASDGRTDAGWTADAAVSGAVNAAAQTPLVPGTTTPARSGNPPTAGTTASADDPTVGGSAVGPTGKLSRSPGASGQPSPPADGRQVAASPDASGETGPSDALAAAGGSPLASPKRTESGTRREDPSRHESSTVHQQVAEPGTPANMAAVGSAAVASASAAVAPPAGAADRQANGDDATRNTSRRPAFIPETSSPGPQASPAALHAISTARTQWVKETQPTTQTRTTAQAQATTQPQSSLAGTADAHAGARAWLGAAREVVSRNTLADGTFATAPAHGRGDAPAGQLLRHTAAHGYTAAMQPQGPSVTTAPLAAGNGQAAANGGLDEGGAQSDARSRDRRPDVPEAARAGGSGASSHAQDATATAAGRPLAHAPARGGAPTLSGPGGLASTQAQHVDRVIHAQEASAARPAHQVTLNVEDGDGVATRVKVALRGVGVTAQIDTGVVAATELQARTGELRRALDRHGLRAEAVQIRPLAAEAAAAGAERHAGTAGSHTSGQNEGRAQSQHRRPDAQHQPQDRRSRRGRNEEEAS